MRRSLTAAALAVAAFAMPASAAIEPWTIVEKVVDGCMDCWPQIMCAGPNPPCPVNELIVPPRP